MRVNIYGEELTNRVEIVRKAVNQQLFIGVRFYVKSPLDLHHSPNDNDESAVTFWMPWTKNKGTDYSFIQVLMDASRLLNTEKNQHD